MSDPFRQTAASADDETLSGLIETGPVSNRLGRATLFEEAQVTDRVFGFLQSDGRRAFDDQRAVVFGERYANRLSAAEANARYGVEGYLTFEQPVNVNRAAEQHRQAVERRFREETAARADLSAAEALGASLLGGATDPVLLPTWFIGGGRAAVSALGVRAATRGGAIRAGAAAGAIDGLTGGIAAEAINAGARVGAGEDYTFGDALRNVLFGVGLGGVVGGAVGGVAGPSAAPPTRLRGRVADIVRDAAEAQGEDAATALRIVELESGGDPRAANRESSARGLFQFIDRTWARFGGGDRFDPNLNATRGVQLLAQNRQALRRALGREPEPWELYLAHQQGAGGATEMLRDPSRPAVDALRAAGVRNPGRAITLNGGRADMTAGQFAGLWRDKFGGGARLEALTPPSPPRPLQALGEAERVGAFAEALEAVADDAPVDLGAMLARTGLSALDEATAAPSIRGRWLEADTAILRDGGELPVRFAVVEIDDLVTSHSDDLTANPGYPQALQPRDRSRPGSQAENYELERDLNPGLLMRDRVASGGAAIISPDGLVESGNGRIIALRRSAGTGTPAWQRYLAELDRQGVDTSGFRRPVLVRMRTEALRGPERARLAEKLNARQTDAYSPVEQARKDAREVGAALLETLGDEDPASAAGRPFQRAFLDRVAVGDKNLLTDRDGALNVQGVALMRAALTQAAYGDARLTSALFEEGAAEVAGIGQALADAAPAWARMRADAPAGLDPTEALASAIELVREARRRRVPVAELFGVRADQIDLLSGETLSPETGAFLRLFYRDEGLTRPRGREAVAEALTAYARRAADTPAGPDLFGDTPDARAFLADVLDTLERAEGPGSRGLAYAGGSEPLWTTREVAAPVLDLRQPEPVQRGSGTGGERPASGGSAARPGGPDGGEPGQSGRLSPEARLAAFIQADPELKALVEDTEALARLTGEQPGFSTAADDPSTVAEAIRAAAICVATEFVA
jgi:hypothetical protein